jgi:NADH-ubiquinone oxidoreductase chain 6
LHNLLLIHESLTNKYSIETLDILSIFIIISGIYIVIIRNPIVSILFLIGLFGGVSSYLIFIGLSFIGLAYLIIYVGAVSILFLFILMLINIRISELQNYNYNSLLLALVILIFLNSSLIQILPYSSTVLNNYLLNINNTLYSISLHRDSINYVYKNVGINHNNNGLLFASSND